MSEKKIIITTGGTGGHFFPAIATAEILLNRGYEVHLIIDLRCKKYLNSDLKFIIHIIDCKIEYKNYLTKLLSVIRIFKGSVKSLFLLSKIKPRIIVGFGSYATFPPMLAGLILRIPIVIHEQNCFMGKVNRLFTRFARNICISYQETKNFNRIYEDKIVVTGSIIRENIRNIKIKDNFSNNPFRIFIFGGSQGAKVFSNLIPQTIKLLIQLNPNVKLYITQQATKNEQIEISRIYTDIGVEHNLSEFFHDMDKQYEIQDLVISRSGASTIAELSAIGLPAIFIPYPFATENHQFYNAKALEDSGASWCFSQSTISAEILANKLLELISNRNILQQASNNLLKRQRYGGQILSDTIERIIV